MVYNPDEIEKDFTPEQEEEILKNDGQSDEENN